MGKFIDRTGQRFGRLTVLARVDEGPASKGRRVKWLCICDCGQQTVATGHALQRGDKSSCGCYQREVAGIINRTHGRSRTAEHNSWRAARSRCRDPKNAKYSEYGGRGITFAARWDDFETFLLDMGPRPEGCTLDRIDPDGDYTPSNCRWADKHAQRVNQRRAKLHHWAGAERTIKDIAQIERVPRTSLNKAIKRLGNVGDALAYVRSVSTRPRVSE